MGVYVDPLQPTRRSSKWRYDYACHLIADDEGELHDFAISLGLRRAWFQKASVLAN